MVIPPLALDVHRIEDLIDHLALGQSAGELNEAVSQRGLAMVDMSYNREVAYAFDRRRGHAPQITSGLRSGKRRARFTVGFIA